MAETKGIEQIVGKTLLIGLTFVDHQGKVLERYETHGKIESISAGLMSIARDEGCFLLPNLAAGMPPAAPGVYTEKNTGAHVVNPDYLATLTVIMEGASDIDTCKKHGFVPPLEMKVGVS